jgi:hypothetical protein
MTWQSVSEVLVVGIYLWYWLKALASFTVKTFDAQHLDCYWLLLELLPVTRKGSPQLGLKVQ